MFWKGVKHIYSPDTITKYDLCCYVNKIYGLNIEIEKHEDSISKNMTLFSNNNVFYKTNNIYEQLMFLPLFFTN